MAKITDWIKEAESQFELLYSKDRRVNNSDLYIVSFVTHQGDHVDAYLYDERITVKKTKYKLMFENFFKVNIVLSKSNSPILTPYAQHRMNYFIGFLFHIPKKGSVIDLLGRFGKLSDDQSMVICMRILEALNFLNEKKLVVSHIPLTSIFVDINEVKLDIMQNLLPREVPLNSQITLNNYMLENLNQGETCILSPELVLDKKINSQTGVYSFGMLFYTFIEVDSDHLGDFSTSA